MEDSIQNDLFEPSAIISLTKPVDSMMPVNILQIKTIAVYQAHDFLNRTHRTLKLSIFPSIFADSKKYRRRYIEIC
jgi:hypothetical protein